MGFPVCRSVALFCLATGGLLDVSISPCKGKGSDEIGRARSLLHNLEEGDVLLGDANFASYWLLALLGARGVKAVCEPNGQRRKVTDFRRGKRLGYGDHLLVYDRPPRPQWMSEERYRSMPETITVRELRTGKGRHAKTLVTTILSSEEASVKDLKALYRDRWRVELNFRDLKTTMGMDVLSCRTPEMIYKQIWAYLLAYNIIRTLMAQAAHRAGRTPSTISFNHTRQLWCAWQSHGSGLDEWALEQLLALVAQKRVGNRPGRCEPRAVKRRPKPFARLWAPRAQARAHVLRRGHA